MASELAVYDTTFVPTVHDCMEDDSRVRIIIGPVGSGKTTGFCYEVMKRALQQEASPKDNIRYFKAAIVRNTMPQLRRTTMKTWESAFPETKIGTMRWSSPMSHTIEFPPHYHEETNELIEPGLYLHVDFFALDTPSDAKSLLSYEGTLIWFNEVREIPKELIDTADDRVGRYPSIAQGGIMPTWHGVIGDTNPPDEDHWIYNFHITDPQKGWKFWQQPPGVFECKFVEGVGWQSIDPENHTLVVTDENYVVKAAGKLWMANPAAENLPYLPVEKKGDDPLGPGGYYLKRVSGKDYDHIRGYYQGRYGPVFDGKPVIPNFQRDLMVVDDLEYMPDLPIMGGIDIGGGTLSPACVFFQKHPCGTYLVLAEVSPGDGGMGLVEFVQAMKSEFAYRFPNGTWGRFYCDPAAQVRDPIFGYTMFSHLQSQGINAQAAPTNDPRDRIEAIKAPMGRLINGKPGVLFHPRCKMLISGLLGGWKFKRVQSSGEERYVDIPSKNKYSHLCDGLGYGFQGSGETKHLRRGNQRKNTAPVAAQANFKIF